PVGVLGGVYLAEYGSARVNSLLRFVADVLNGVPSITWGVVVYGLVVLRFKGFSAYAGGLALVLIMIPLIIRTTEEVILLVPNGYREAALALGVSRWKTIVHIVMKTASKGIITGILLALARVGGETAPLLFTAFGNRFWNHNLAEPTSTSTSEPAAPLTFEVKNLSVWYAEKRAIDDVTLDIASNAVTAIIGPSGCGKSTFLRCLNRMHELVPKTRVDGTVLLQGDDLYSNSVDPAIVRRRVGMVFQKSNPFPTMSIGENVVIGLRLNGVRNQKFLNE